jgi:RNA polymerase-binding transcription factor DksA
MRANDQQRYQRILTRLVNSAYSPPAEGPLPQADWEEQAAELHDRYVARVDDEIRWEVREAARRALARLRQGDFGSCIDCGEEISPKRLAAVPWTERCVRCQSRTEQHRQTRRAAVAYFAGERTAA